MPLSLGLDFGTESARAVLVDVATGVLVARGVAVYEHGVIDDRLPGTSVSLPPEFALQDPDDWRVSMAAAVREAMQSAGVKESDVVGVGIDFTSCTILPTTADGTPQCEVPGYRTRPHAWPKLWKHHAAQPQANRINEAAAASKSAWLPRYGGKISSEWVMPKALQIAEEDAACYAASDRIVEGGDWIVWQLTGTLVRNACAAGYKGTWHTVDGWVSREFLEHLHPDLGGLFEEKFSGAIVPAGTHAGGLLPEWAARLGLRAGTPVGAAMIDAHAACLGAGISTPGILYMTTGTSTCHMLMDEREHLVPGISGVVESGIVPGLYGYEAGQASAGDTMKWFVDHAVPPAYHTEAAQRGISLHDVLMERSSSQLPGESGLVALDWWNGCRTPLVDAELSGMILGLTLSTRSEDIYRALVEATAFGTRMIIETFAGHGVPVHSIAAGGGLTRNPAVMQLYADVTGREISIVGDAEASARGAAVLGAVAAGGSAGGYASIPEACARMSATPSMVLHPNPEYAATYDALYEEYAKLTRHFGEHGSEVMRTLRRFKSQRRTM